MNLVFKSFVEDGNDMVLEDHIVDAISFRGGMSGTSGILLNFTNLPTSNISKQFRSKIVKSRSTHEIIWDVSYASIYEASGITAPEIVTRINLDKYINNDLMLLLKMCSDL